VRDERLYGFGIPADDGLYLACVMPPAGEYQRFMDAMEASWEREVAGLHWVGERVAEGRRVGRPRGLRSVDTFLRDATGPGWCCSATPATSRTLPPARGSPTRCGRPSACPRPSSPAWAPATWTRACTTGGRGATTTRSSVTPGRTGSARPARRRASCSRPQRQTLARRDPAERFWGPSLQRLRPGRALGRNAVLRATAGAVARRRVAPTRALAELRDAGRRDAAYRRARRTARGRRPRR
jgi:hypothetical protein